MSSASLPDPAAIQAQHRADQTADNLSVSNAVTSLRAIGDADWTDIVARSSTLMNLMLSSPVFEAEHGEVTAVTQIRRHVPVEEYLRPQKRFAHLFSGAGQPGVIEKIQAEADRNIRRFKLLDEAQQEA